MESKTYKSCIRVDFSQRPTVIHATPHNTQRIKDCVNACADIPNPKAISDMVEFLRSLLYKDRSWKDARIILARLGVEEL